jgi:hypothetical protein
MKNQSPRGMTPNPIRDEVLKRMLKMPPKPHKGDKDAASKSSVPSPVRGSRVGAKRSGIKGK